MKNRKNVKKARKRKLEGCKTQEVGETETVANVKDTTAVDTADATTDTITDTTSVNVAVTAAENAADVVDFSIDN